MRTFSAIRHLLLFFMPLACLVAIPQLQAGNDNDFLTQHSSSYLRSHADDAIKWHAFSQDTFQLAQQQLKPILLSSGYASCYWCHRMKEDSFKNTDVGKVVNQFFIPILIDRELEPETDQWLQRFMEQQRGFGGWPLTVILTPDSAPIAGYNYTTGSEFTAALQRFTKDWKKNPQEITGLAENNKKAMQQGSDNEEYTVSTNQLLQGLLQQLAAAADNDYGGFGEGEKFPYVPQLNALFELQALNHDPALEQFLATTLSAIIGSRLRDHIGGGFFRYTDDQHWGRPHYEKMLYTQALLAPLLIRAGETWRSTVYTDTGRETLLHMIRAFQRNDGYFRSGLSAVGEKGQAGGYYLWTISQLNEILAPNDRNKIINLLGEEAKLVLPFPLVVGEAKRVMQADFIAVRSKRQLQADDKALTGWNGLALSSLAIGGVLGPDIQRAGEKLANQLLVLAEQERIPQLADQVTTKVSEADFTAKVYLAKGLADWGKHNNEEKYLDAAKRLLLRIQKRYYQEDGWAYTENNPLLGTVIRQYLPDSQLPSASALWLQTAYNLTSLKPQKNTELATLVTGISSQQSAELEDVHDEAFFHSTYIAERVKQQIIKPQPKGVMAQ